MATELILIRHGITNWNKARRYCGCKDVPLSSEGRAQAVKLHRKLKDVCFDRIYSSDRKRALETCRIIFGRVRIAKVKGLREINFGVFEGLRHTEIMKKYGPVYKKWLSDPYQHHIPRAEKMADFKKRIYVSFAKIARANPDKTVAVVCHGGVIGVFVGGIYRSKDFWRYVPGATSVTVVKYKNRTPRIMKFNDIAHLG
ncbi:MAG: histidine phosphatase family protein [Candidatus Omnitrophica bacterium]|nr:histidine phosphatase family protein [Candidatus Omnitrophota bacterium]